MGLRVPRRIRVADGGLCAVCGDGSLDQQVGEARRIGPGQCVTAGCDLFLDSDLLLDDGAGVFRNAEIAAARELGEDGGLAAARAYGDDVEGWKLNLQRILI
jgi:hypothetical protein